MMFKTLLLALAGSVPIIAGPVPTHLYGAPLLPEDPQTTLLPSLFPSNYPENTTIHVLPSTGNTRTVQSTTISSAHPISSAPSITSPSQITSSSTPLPTSASEPFSTTSPPTTSPIRPLGVISPPSSTLLHPRGGIITLTGTRIPPGWSKPTTSPISPPDNILDNPRITILTGTVLPSVSKQSSISPSPTSKVSQTSPEVVSTISLIPPSPTATAIAGEELHEPLTAVIDAVGSEDGIDKTRLAVGLGIGLGAGIPAAGLVRWLSTALHTISTIAENGNVQKAVMDDLTQFRLDKVPHFNSNPKLPGGGSLVSEVAKSVDEYYDALGRNGNTGEQAAEIINNFDADLKAAEAAMAGQAVDVKSVVQAAAGRTFSNPNVVNSWAVQAAAQLASTPGASAEEIANSLLNAGVPADVLSTTAEAISHAISQEAVSRAISQAPNGWTGRLAYNAALGVISSSVTSASIAAVEAANAAVKGATGPDLASSLGPAGVPAAVADATAQAMIEAIQAAKASWSDPTVAAINVISKAASLTGLAVAEAFEGATGSSLAPALSAAGVPMEALGTTADAVSAVFAISFDGGAASADLNAAADIIDSASVPWYERMSNPAPAVSPAQAALDVVGASFNFWHIVPWIVWDTLNMLNDDATEDSEMEIMESLLAIGPPPDFTTNFLFPTFPYRRGGNRVAGLPSLQTDASRPIPSSTHNGMPPSKPTLKPPPPGTGGYLFDGTEAAPII